MTLNKTECEGERAVSPVIGVILMVAITVILAAVIGTFVLGLGENVDETPTAGISYDQNAANDVTMTWVSEGNVDPSSTDLDVSGDCGSGTLSTIGDTLTLTGCSPGDKITITGELSSGERGVVSQYTVK